MAGALYGADQYAIDPVHTNIGFSVRHLMINNVNGKFTGFSGSILYDENDVTKSSVKVAIKSASIDTGNPNRDNDLRGPNYLDATKFPEITFESNRVEKHGDGFVAHGTLMLHGVSKEIALPFSITGKIKDPWGKTRLGVEAGLAVNRRDYGITIGQTFGDGTLVVGNDVKIALTVEAVK